MKQKISSLLQKLSSLLKGGFFHIFVGTFLNKAITMISSIVVARLVTKSQYAYLSYSDTIYGYILLFSGLGLPSAILKTCSEKRGEEKDKGYLSYAMKTGVLLELLISVIVVIACSVMPLPFPQAELYIWVALLYPTFHYVYELLLCYIRTQQKNKEYAYLNLLYSFLTCALSVGAVMLFDAIGLLYARYLTLFIVSAILIYMVIAILKPYDISPLEKNEKKKLWVLAISLVIANAFTGMMPYNENMLISHMIADETTVANFKVANLFPQMIVLVSQAVNVYFFPIVTKMVASKQNVKKYVVKVGLLNLGIVVLACAVGMIATPILIPLLYGKKYTDAIALSYPLWIMRGLNAGIRMVPTNMLVAIGKHQINLIASIGALILQLALDICFISKYGVYGVAVGTIAVYLIIGSLLWIAFLHYADKKKLS